MSKASRERTCSAVHTGSTAPSRNPRSQIEDVREEALAEDDEMPKSDIQQAIEREARRAALLTIADLDLAGGSQLLVSGMAGVARVLDMSRCKVHRLRAAAASNGIPFPKPALYAGLGGTKCYWLRDIEGWVEEVSASGMDW